MERDAGGVAGYRATVLFRARDWRRRGPAHVFGGRPLLDAELPASAATGRPLHLAFDFDVSDPRLAGLGVTTVQRLAVLVSYGCDSAQKPLLVRHHDGGRRLELLAEPTSRTAGDLPDELPQLPVDLEALSDAEASVERVSDLPEGHGPLHQVGGRPVWHARALAAPRCPKSGKPMRFVAAVDTMYRFPLGDSEAHLTFGDGGTCYVFWSDEPSISAAICQEP